MKKEKKAAGEPIAGPWRAGQFTDGETWEVFDADKDPVCGCFKVGKRNHEANARLIAAAPDLRALADIGYGLSTWAASIRWSQKYTNTEEWLDGLRTRIEAYQEEYERVIAKSRGEQS